jgi:3-oxoacyl-[acyl-carrier protein] reductase
MTQQILQGKVAVVTGASRGIGRAIALRLARDGARVALNYVGDDSAAQEALELVRKDSKDARSYRADVSKPPEIRSLFSAVESDFGGFDIFVANAGRGVIKPVIELTEEDFDRVFSLNTRGTFFCLQEAARRSRDGGRIVAISSAITRLGGPGTSVYAASKAAVEYFTAALSKELGSRGITVNAVLPGYTEAGGLDRVPSEFREQGRKASPFGRLGVPADIAAVVAFLVGPDGGWITGTTILATGGAV